MTVSKTSLVAVVTGGTTGIGLATARRLLGAGMRVGVFSQNARHVARASNELAAEFGAESVHARAVDLVDVKAVAGFFDEISGRWEAPSVLVANAGFSPKGAGGRSPFAEISIQEWDSVLAVNLRGAMLCCQATAPTMAARGYGRIVLIGSVAARTVPRIAGASYVASKAGLSGLARALIAEYSGTGLTVNTVAPGRILTDMTGPPDSPANQEALARIPVGRLGTPDDVAALVGFLVSAEAGFINGAVIDANGGEYVPV